MPLAPRRLRLPAELSNASRARRGEMGEQVWRESRDAAVWAREFCRIKREQGWTLADIDEGLMLGWFANAMEAMREDDPGEPGEEG